MQAGKFSRRAVARTAILVAGTLSAAADTLVVATDGSGDFLQISAAVAAASDGDTVFVQPGFYLSFTVSDLDLDILAVGATVHGVVEIRSLSAGKEVSLVGLRVLGRLVGISAGDTLRLVDNAGTVRGVECTLEGSTTADAHVCTDELLPGGDAVIIENCADVVLLGCTALGGDPVDQSSTQAQACLDKTFVPGFGGPGGRGIVATNSSMVLYDCTVSGGDGGNSTLAGHGGQGVRLVASQLFAAGGEMIGEFTGISLDFAGGGPCSHPGSALFADAASSASVLDVAFQVFQHHDAACGSLFGPVLPVAGTGSVTIHTGTDAAVYCAPTPTSLGCLPTIGAVGFASESGAAPFSIGATEVHNSTNGLLFYGLSPAAIPFLGGTLCVTPPLRRTAVQNSGGAPPPSVGCTGGFAFDMAALIASGLDTANLVAVAEIFAQYYFRAGGPLTAGLSDALAFEIHNL